VTRRRDPHGSTRRYGEDDNLPVQGINGIAIVAGVTVTFAALGFATAVIVSWIF